MYIEVTNEKFPLILGFLNLWSNFDCLSWYIFSFFHCLFWSNFDCCVWMCTFQKSCVDISDKIKTFAIFFFFQTFIWLSGSNNQFRNTNFQKSLNQAKTTFKVQWAILGTLQVKSQSGSCNEIWILRPFSEADLSNVLSYTLPLARPSSS